jgi:hypothetical protein|tara:strand:- start:91 stop:681 length:591 start_codon:yes stop_codon:yes gene_type:complete
MKNIFYLIIVFSLFSCNDNDKIVFSITKPINWIDYTEYYQDNKLKKQNLNLLLKEGIFKEELIESVNSSLYVFTKYALTENVNKNIFIPSVQVSVELSSPLKLMDMKEYSKRVIGLLRESVDDYELISNTYTEINKRKVFVIHSKFKFNILNQNLNSKSYFFFPKKKGIYYNVTLTDTESDKCNIIFNELLSSIEF